MKLTPSQFAKVIGVSTRRINAAIQSGVLYNSVEKQPYGIKTRYFIDQGAGQREWSENIDFSKQRDVSKATQTKGMLQDKNSQFYKAKTVNAVYKAKLVQMEYLILAGELIPADQVSQQSFKVGRRLRDSLFSIPDRIAAELCCMTDKNDIHNLIVAHLDNALVNLKDLKEMSKKVTVTA